MNTTSKTIILSLVSLLLTPTIFSQNSYKNHKPIWFDIQLVEQVGLNNWFDKGYANDGVSRASITELRVVINIPFSDYVGIYGDTGLGFMPAAPMKSFDLGKMQMPHSGTQYYLREMLSEEGSGKAQVSFKMSLGMFGKIPVNKKLSVMPYLGIGFITRRAREYSVLLKEHGSNVQYESTYSWNQNNNEEKDQVSLPGYLNGKMNFAYRLSSKASLLLGVEYTWIFSKLNYYEKHVNQFNQNIRKNQIIKGNKMNMIGLSLGVSFM
ncbi:MAG: hypothetical protein GX905_05910 [Bacteroidales bacterium]|nr:hypothetical protein [Bacteroidales bacterium]